MWYCLINIPREQVKETIEILRKHNFEATSNFQGGIWVVTYSQRQETILRLISPGLVVSYENFSSVMRDSPTTD